MSRKEPKPDRVEYDRLASAEIEHYSEIFSGPSAKKARRTLLQPVPNSWTEIEKRAAELVRSRSGADMRGHVLARLQRSPGTRMLSLGSGPGGIEIALAAQAPDAHITCVDLNAGLMDLGRERARQQHLNVTFEAADLNFVVLPPREYDLVFCHASLHHVLELEHVIEQIRRTLQPSGELIVEDICSRNGYFMWDETREVVRRIFQSLPPRFRVNQTGFSKPRIDEEIWEADTSAGSMECIRSEDIVPLLAEAFDVRCYIPYFALCRRFFDTMYGPNYDLSRTLDLALLNWIWELDLYYLERKQLRPETFFGIYGAR